MKLEKNKVVVQSNKCNGQLFITIPHNISVRYGITPKTIICFEEDRLCNKLEVKKMVRLFDERNCKNCGISLTNNIFESQGVNFNDGWYCKGCARKRKLKGNVKVKKEDDLDIFEL